MEKIKKHNMPVAIYHVIEKYIQKMKEKGWDKNLPKNSALRLRTLEERQKFVEELIFAYKKLSRNARKDFLIPENGKYLKSNCLLSRTLSIEQQEIAGYETEYAFAYKWALIKNKDVWKDYNPMRATGFDRIGGRGGEFFCPVLEEKTFSIHTRSLPYFFFEKEMKNIKSCPSYHLYKFRVFKNTHFVARKTASGFDKKGGAHEILVRSFSNKIVLKAATLLEKGVFEEVIVDE